VSSGFDPESCCDYWFDGTKLNTGNIEVVLTPAASCDCGGSGGLDDILLLDECSTEAIVVLCDDVVTLSVHLTIQCPQCVDNGGDTFRLQWSIVSDELGCPEASGFADAYSVDCDEDSFKICWGPIGGIPSTICCDGGTGADGTWDICFESS
jgi:hypothetical protein